MWLGEFCFCFFTPQPLSLIHRGERGTRGTHATVKLPRSATLGDARNIIMVLAAADGKLKRDFLRSHMTALLAFYDPIVLDPAGGYFNQLRDDGTVYDAKTKHVVGTCRFSVNYALASRCFPEREDKYRGMCAHGIAFLAERHNDKDHGGFSWVVTADGEVTDGTKWCYSIAFGLLALSNAKMAGVPEVDAHLTSLMDLAESRFYEPAHGLYIDSFDRTLKTANVYRGQNANMHMCEALIAAYEATGEQRHLERAKLIARQLTVELSAGCGWVVEHYTSDWKADPHKNRDCDPSSEGERQMHRPPRALSPRRQLTACAHSTHLRWAGGTTTPFRGAQSTSFAHPASNPAIMQSGQSCSSSSTVTMQCSRIAAPPTPRSTRGCWRQPRVSSPRLSITAGTKRAAVGSCTWSRRRRRGAAAADSECATATSTIGRSRR